MARLVVRGDDVRKPPLLETKDARAVEVFDSRGRLVALMYRMFDTEIWGVSTVQDDDWEQVKRQLGYSKPALDVKEKRGFFDI